MGNCNAGPIRTKALTIAHPIYEIRTIDGSPAQFGQQQTNLALKTKNNKNNNNQNFSISNPIVYRALW